MGLALLLAAPLHAAERQPAKNAAETPPAARTRTRPGAHTAAAIPLTPRERIVQLLDRFTFGPRPGEVDRVLAMGADAWLAEQLNPDGVADAALQKRLGDYPTLSMSPAQALTAFPGRAQVLSVADGKTPYPDDPLLHSVYEVQVYKANRERAQKPGAPPQPADAEKAAQKKLDQGTAARIAGELFALPRNQRMAALIQMPVEDRVAFTGNGDLSGDQRALLLAEFTPREREAFEAMSGEVNSTGFIGNELEQARLLRDILSERQLQTVMTGFWMNHFNVFLPKDSDQWYTTSYERDAIRPHALGSFRDLLLATAESPAMMIYLDNWLSIGPDSLANGVNPRNPKSQKGNRGLNENYGREIMELHTLGVNGGYTQADVTALSAILTGWGVDRPAQGGPFLFDPRRHEPGAKIWFGYRIEDNGAVTPLAAGSRPAAESGVSGASGVSNGSPGAATTDSMKQGIAALNILAASEKTAHFISYLLAQYFVADDPPPALVDRLQGVYLSSHGDIKTILRALIASPEFNSRRYFRIEVKTPEEFVASAFRTTATDPQNPGALANTLRTLGMPLYKALPPTGYYLTANQWMNSGALVDRLNFSYQLTNSKFANQKFDAPRVLAMGLLTSSALSNGSGSGLQTAAPAKPSTGQAKQTAEEKQATLLGVAAPRSTASTPHALSVLPDAGTQVAIRLLEATLVGAPVSAQTNRLIENQLQQLPANSSPIDTLNLITALVMGAPEFQLR